MVNKKEIVVKDLRNYVIEVTFNSTVKDNQIRRVTLKPDLMPPNYNESIKNDEINFNNNLDEYIIAWDVRLNQWKKFDINTISYLQIIDNY